MLWIHGLVPLGLACTVVRSFISRLLSRWDQCLHCSSSRHWKHTNSIKQKHTALSCHSPEEKHTALCCHYTPNILHCLPPKNFSRKFEGRSKINRFWAWRLLLEILWFRNINEQIILVVVRKGKKCLCKDKTWTVSRNRVITVVMTIPTQCSYVTLHRTSHYISLHCW